MGLKCIQKLVALNWPVLNETALSTHQDIWLIDLVKVSRSSLVLKGLNNVLATGLQVNDSQQNLWLVIIRKAQHSRGVLILQAISKLNHFIAIACLGPYWTSVCIVTNRLMIIVASHYWALFVMRLWISSSTLISINVLNGKQSVGVSRWRPYIYVTEDASGGKILVFKLLEWAHLDNRV